MVGLSSKRGIGAARERVGRRARLRRLGWYVFAFIALVVGVLLLPKADLAVTAWEKMAIPVVVQDPNFEVLAVVSAPNVSSTNPGHLAWAVGGVNDSADDTNSLGVALSYNRSNWSAQKTNERGRRRLKDVEAWRDDRGTPSLTDDIFRVWAVGQAYSVSPPQPGWLMKTNTYPSGATDDWTNVTITPPVANDEAWLLHDADFYDGTTGIVAGSNPLRLNYPTDTYAPRFKCNLWRTTDAGTSWVRPTTPPPAVDNRPAVPVGACRHITNVAFARDYDVNNGAPDAVGNRPRKAYAGLPNKGFAWLTFASKESVGENAYAANADEVYWSQDKGNTWALFGLTGNAGQAQRLSWKDLDVMYYQGAYHLWLVGENTDDNTQYIRYLRCTEPGAPVEATDCDQRANMNFTDIRAPIASLFAPGGVPDINDFSVTIDTAGTPGPTDDTVRAWLAFGSSSAPGGVATTDSLLVQAGLGARWVFDSVGSVGAVNAVFGFDPGHAFAGGVNQTLLKRQPGNLTGWAWFGADSCSRRCAPALDPTCLNLCPDTGGPPMPEQPLGWMSLTCVNSLSCLRQAFSYGLTVVLEREKGYCSNDSSRSCTANPECNVPGTCVTVTSCAASPAGTNQRTDVGALSGYAWIGADDPDQTLGGAPASRPVGWVGFDRRGICSNNSGQSCTLDADCGGANTCQFSGLVSGVPVAPPSTPFNSFPLDFVSACNKTITASSPQRYAQAFLDYRNDRLEGWARIASSDLLAAGRGWIRLRGPYQCGQAWCSANRSIECVNANGVYTACPAGAGTCDATASEAVKCVEMGYGPATPPLPSHYAGCTDCQEVSGKLVCNICSHVKSADWWNISYAKRRPFTVTMNATAASVGDTVSFFVDLDNELPGAEADYRDIRVVYRLDGGQLELPRQIVNPTPAADPADEEIRIKLVRSIPANTPDPNFYIYYDNGSAGVPVVDLHRVYTYFEDFSSDVFASGAWTRSAGCVGKIVYSATNRRLESIVSDNCYAYTAPSVMSVDLSSKGYHVEAQISAVAGPAFPQGSVGFFESDPGGKLWAGIDERNNTTFARGTLPVGLIGSAPVAGGIDLVTLYDVHWTVKPNGSGGRLHTVRVNGQTSLNEALEASPQINAVYPAIHVWGSVSTWDDFRVWAALGESADWGGAPEGPTGSTRYELWSCNSCGKNSAVGSRCGTGRCDPATSPPGQEYKVCRSGTDCGAGSCAPSGFCSDSGAICFGEIPGGDAGLGLCDSTRSRCEQIGENVCDQCDACSLYGVSLDPRGGSISGFGYSQDFGFVDLSLAYLYNPAWFQALQGSIYAGSNIGSPATRTAPGIAAPIGDPARVDFCNATFGIHADGSISNVCSGQQAAEQAVDPLTSPYVRPDFGQLGLPTAATGYQALLDKLHLDDLTTEVGVTGKNVFGSTLHSLSRDATWEDDVAGFFPEGCLKNTVIVVNGDFTLNPDLVTTHPDDDASTITFEPCPPDSGRGTLVVKGNLTVTTDLQYVNTPAARKVSQIPSFGVIVVRANTSDPAPTVTIHEDVEKTAFNLFTEGAVTVRGTSLVNQTDKQYQNSGVMVAASFSLNRNFTGTIDQPEPAERITDDGRLRINPPPGFEGFGQSLPQIRESRP